MKQINLSLVFSVLLGLFATNAEALVIYNWYDASPGHDIGTINASIAFDDSVWKLGDTFVYDGSKTNGEPQPSFGVVSMYFATPAGLGSTLHAGLVGSADPMRLSQVTCAQSVPYGFGWDASAYCASRGLAPDDFVVSAGYWKFDLTFGEFLQGSMYMNDTHSDVHMSSQDALFKIDELRSDSPLLCSQDVAACSDGAGYWKLANATMPVSEPDTVLLLTLGLVPLAVAQRRRMAKRRVQAV